MRYFSCDICGTGMTEESSDRFIVKFEAAPATPATELTEVDLDQDHLDTMAEMLEDLDEDNLDALTPTIRLMEYDLCRRCMDKMLADPLGRQRTSTPRYSTN